MSMTTTQPRATSNGHRPPPVRVAGSRDRRMPWLALGVVLVLGGGLGAGLLVQSAGERSSVVAAARPIAQGQIITDADLRIVDAAVDGDANLVPSSQRLGLVGQVATTRIMEGALLATGQFAPGGGLPEGTVIVGAPLGPGQIPVPNMQPGNRVRMISASGDSLPPEVLGVATIFSIAAGSQGGSQFVSLAVDDEIADAVAQVIAQQRLRLILLPSEG